jgi:hypothetical protein
MIGSAVRLSRSFPTAKNLVSCTASATAKPEENFQISVATIASEGGSILFDE